MRTYSQFCPVAKAAEIFAERWTPLIIRELYSGSTRFNEVKSGVPGISGSLLAQRLRMLVDVGVVDRRQPDGGRLIQYVLTPQGLELIPAIQLLGEWGMRWLERDIEIADLQPQLLMWDMHKRVVLDRLPRERVVVQVDFTGHRTVTIWLVLERPEPSVCDHDPGFEVDLFVSADTLTIHRVWMGLLSWRSALSDGLITFQGPPAYRRDFPDWFRLNHFSNVAIPIAAG